ncbi:MAG: L-seryl-tRNA(Sec) selenium transferase [Planctomycetia bacterium]|nr:L-seryl-tRNA(Sec) selenium transferase [Planctomycetia bacterium]
MAPNPLRSIPSVNELLESPAIKAVVDRIHPGAVMATVRSVLDEVAAEMRSAAVERTWPSVSELAERISRRVFDGDAPDVKPAINATGVLFHPELGCPPLADDAVKAMVVAAGEYTLGPGPGAQRDSAGQSDCVERLLKNLTGAEAAFVAVSDVAATVLALTALAALAAGREVIVARAQLIQRGDHYRWPELAAAAGVALREVGAVNHLLPEDYARAITDRSAALAMVHPGSVAIVGGTAGATLEDVVSLGRHHALPVIHDLGPAGLFDLAPFGLAAAPVVSESIAAGADLVLFGHEMFGGPACGIIASRQTWVDRIRRSPMAGAFQPPPPTLAALAATLRLIETPEKAHRVIPVLQLATTSAENLKNRAERLAAQIGAASTVEIAEPAPTAGSLYPAPVIGAELPGWCVRIKPSGISVVRLAEALRSGAPAVVGLAEQDHLVLNLRSVLPRQDTALVEAIGAVAAR